MAEKMKSPSGSTFDFGPFADGYESWYTTEEGRAHDLVQQKDVEEVLRNAPSSGHLLEVGCGTGHWSRFFYSLGYDVCGVDVSEEMIAVARKNVPGCCFDISDARDLPFSASSFDIVASITALEFIPDPEAAIMEMVRCVRPGGALVLGTLNRLAPINRDRLEKGEEPYASGHLFSPDELMDAVAPLGETGMTASSLDQGQNPPRILGPGDRSLFGELLKGPLLVAVVRLPER